MVHDLKLTPRGEVDGYPLSPMQQGMLFHRISGRAAGVDVEQVICEVHEVIHAAMFGRAWSEVVSRHATLRTGFQWEDGHSPRQVVYPPSRVGLVLNHQDFGSDLEARRGVEEYLAADRREGFSALTPPLLRVALLRGGPMHFWFVATYHHLLLDARSMTILFREVMDLHDAFIHGRDLNLPKPRVYRAYIDWLQSHDLLRAESFWREQLRGFRATTVLPISSGGAGSNAPGEATHELVFRLPEATTSTLRSVALKHEVTLNTIVQAVWAVVLSRYTGEEDVVFGAVRACRKIPIEGADSIVGLFINTVPFRVRLTAATPIASWLRQLREQWIGLRDYEHTPLVKIQQWSEVAPGQSLFESILSYQEPAWDAALNALGGAWANRSFDIRAQPNCPIALEVLAGAKLTIKAIYDPTYFASDAIARLMGHLRVVFEAFAAENVDTVGALPLLTREELQIFQEWNNTLSDYPRDRCVHTFVEAHAQGAPERIAVADASQSLSYSELNDRANRLARRLQSLGVTRGELVSVCMERSVEMIVAWLGVLKAGGAFVPLDPAYPKERIAFQVEDCGARVLLIQPDIRPRLPQLASRVTIVELSPDATELDGEGAHDLPCTVASSDLAYVIYTSGSTGQPKGVEVEHRALMNLVSWHQRAYALSRDDRATHLASPAFDASIWEIWPYLAAGGSVHIPDDETRLSPAQLWRWMGDTRISLAFMPTPLAEAAMNEPWPDGLALRALLTGGDKLKRPPPPNFPCPLINHYGPTESAVVATSVVIAPVVTSDALPPIGKPITNTQAHVLDRHFRPVPVGVPGELFIAGESLARGYLRRPELTEEKFITVSLANRAEVRLYRTGDRVRWSASGNLEFLGRLDGQIKIRGCRIEIGEIETAIQQDPSVRECIVVARPDAREELQLFAYVLPAYEGAHLNAGNLVEFLRAKLPSYMIPAGIIVLDAWPLTPNGKVDRDALPSAASVAAVPELRSAPDTAVEKDISRVWADVLGREAIRREDNFFELGGHSLLAAQVVSRLNAILRATISVRSLFEHPTLTGFAREVEQRVETNPIPRAPVQRMRRRVARPDVELVQPN